MLIANKKFKNIFLISIIFFMHACTPAPENSKRKTLLNSSKSTAKKPETKIPVFTEGNNFIQNGGEIYTSAVNFDISFTDSIQLRGKDVDSYIRNNGTQAISCLTARFTDVIPGQVNILAAVPHSVYSFTTFTLEYFYSISPSNDVDNKNFCQKVGLLNKLFSLYPTLTPKFKISDLCPGGACTSSTYLSQSLELYTPSGTAITQVGLSQLRYNISNRPNIDSPIGQTCINNSQCTALGYNCCSLGQCVKDLALKPGVDQTSPNYVQALQDILNTPSHIYLYPQYYFICSAPTNQPNPNTPTTDPTRAANARLKNLTSLYECTTKIEGELGYCTKTISNAAIYTISNPVVHSAGVDDKSFSGTYTNQSSTGYTPTDILDLISVQEISYGEVTLFNYDQIADETALRPDPYVVSSYLTLYGHHNDNETTGTAIRITQKPSTALSDDLVIKYKTDASCTRINTNLGKCEKYYVQGQQKSGDTLVKNRRGRVTDHYPASNYFKLPYYTDTSKSVTVEVDGSIVREGVDWQLNTTSPATVQFNIVNSALTIFDTQKVKITFFVDLSVYHVMDSKLDALSKIKDICHCADLNCSLAPIKDTAGVIKDYSCIFPDPTPVTPPISQTVYLSAKTVPVRYFDSSGVSKSIVDGSTLPQEGDNVFSYRGNNLLNPVNMPDITNPTSDDTYVGFNEIYGSLTYSNNSAKPAKEVPVTKGKTYDIYVDGGSYSNCLQCGNDYYSQLTKLFPLAQFGGGITPFQARTDRVQSNGVRADDMLFGRACFVPATMLPWTHAIDSDLQTQRLSRMRAQHFLYANGYQRDWYGFDYGAVIGSFDGVKWFAVGTNRRIKANTNKLFLAINAPFGDLAIEGTYTVTVNDGSLNPIGSNLITSDLESDGAQCQKFHQCSTDNDCATTLGWDYMCTSVVETSTSWPRFDDNAKEIPDVNDKKTLSSILGYSVPGKRCVYRGRGTACSQNYNLNILQSRVDNGNTFNLTTDAAQHVCSANNYCQAIGGANFNNRIARYGKVRTDSTSDSFGLATKVIGRPMEFNASETIRSETLRNFNANKLAGICIPGRSPDTSSATPFDFYAQNSTAPASDYTGDKILGIGMSYTKNISQNTAYLSSCAALDSTNNYFLKNPATVITGNTTLQYYSGSQSISTNALYKFVTPMQSIGVSFKLYTNNTDTLTAQTFTENRCMRAPGASCFSDQECAPSKVIADKIKMLGNTVASSILNSYEVKFWQEELICSQAMPKTNAAYTSSLNRCCREVGKTISIASGDSINGISMDKIPGIDINMSDATRYSRVSTVYKDQKTDPTNYPKLQVAVKDECPGATCKNISVLTNQFKTFSAYAERTSCSSDWIRNFSNGNHNWDSTRLQKFKPETFRCMNWLPSSDVSASKQWSCEGMEENDPKCPLVQTSPYSTKAKNIMKFLGKLELMGIPQIAIESENFYNTATAGDLSCLADPTNHTNIAYPPGGLYTYPTQIYTAAAVKEYTNGSISLYSAGDETNFQNMKKVFKSDEVASCRPAGSLMEVGEDKNLCCTGFINAQTKKCQLPDYVDLSVYTNRYVSSEAKKLNVSLFDENGYIKDPSYVAQLACEKEMCASGKITYGILISRLKIPGQGNIETKYYRFMQGDTPTDNANGLADLYNSGLKINTHAYCLPANVAGGEDDLTIISCVGN